MKFCIRDDDTCFYTSEQTLERIYGDIWDTCPVTLACIPYVSPNTDAHVEPTDSSPRDIGENSKLSSYISKRLSEGTAEIALHGYHHDTQNGRPEFVASHNLHQKVIDGINRLQRAFGCDIELFVPPHVRLSNKGVKAVSESGLDIVRGRGPRPREVQANPKWGLSYAKLLAFYVRYGREYRYPYPLDFGSHWEVFSHRLNNTTEMQWCKRSLNFINKKDGVYCLSVHANNLNKEGKYKLEEVISYAQELGADFVTASAAIEQINM